MLTQLADRPWSSAVPTANRPGPTSLRVAIVDEELPYPPNSGKRIRTLNLLLRLAPRHRLTFLCHRNADPGEAQEAEAFFNRQGIATIMVSRSVPPKSGPGFYARLAANLLSPLPYSVATHVSAELRQAVMEHAAAGAVDLWQCEWTPYAEMLRGLRGVPWLIVAHNVESVIWQRYHETESGRLKRWYIRGQWRKFERFERWAFAAAARTVAVSDGDAARIREDFGATAVEIVDNGVDTAFFRPGQAEPEPGRILFLGSLDWRPNLDAVRLLLDEIFPIVRAHEPAARLALVGRRPPEWLRSEAVRRPGVELCADPPNVRPHLARAAVMAVPLRIGGGSRLKILEALACGVPVVSTRIGAEGLRLEPGRHLAVVEDASSMADALLLALRHPEAARAMASTGRQLVSEHYDWSVLADRLEQVWLACVGWRREQP